MAFSLRVPGSLLAPALCMALCTSAAAGEAPVLLEVRLHRHQLAEAMVAWPGVATAQEPGGELALPLGELARLLTLAIRTDPAAGTASGYLLSPEHPFSLDAASGGVLIGERREQVDPALLLRERDDIYVPARLLARWLPLDLRVDLSTLTLEVVPRVRLPLEGALARREQRVHAPQPYRDPGFPRVDLPYAMVSAPFLDQSVGIDAVHSPGEGGRSQGAVNYSAFASADLLGMQAALFTGLHLQRSTGAASVAAGTQSFTRRDSIVRLTLGRRDPQANLLGPLHASTALLGSVPVAAVDHVSHTGTAGAGFLLSNAPLGVPASFDRHSLEGDLAAGWDVELFYNGALVGFQQAASDGRYRFDALPLSYGANEFRLVFHGPLGQLRVERRTILLEQSALAPGALVYMAAAQRASDHPAGAVRALARLDAGITRTLSASAALVRLPADAVNGVAEPARPADYLSLALHGYFPALIAGVGVVQSNSGGRLVEASIKTRVNGVAVAASSALLRDFSSEIYRPTTDPVKQRDELRIDGAPGFGAAPVSARGALEAEVPASPAWLFPLAFQLRRDTLASSRQLIEAQLRAAFFYHATALSNVLRWQSLAGQRAADGSFSLSRRSASGGLSAQLQYGLLPHRALSTLSITADAVLGAGGLASVGLGRDFSGGPGRYRLNAGYHRSFGSLALGVTGFYSRRGEVGVGLRLFTAFGREPRQGLWRASAQPAAAGGAASVRAYLDRNGNGVFDGDDMPITEAAFTVNGARHNARSAPDGSALLDRLPVNAAVDLAIDPNSLPDPQWAVAQRGVRLLARPGAVAQVDLAVSISGDVDGTVWRAGTPRRPAPGQVVELVDTAGAVAAQVTTGADGYFLFPTVLPGRYRLRAGAAERELAMGAQGDSLSGRDLTLP